MKLLEDLERNCRNIVPCSAIIALLLWSTGMHSVIIMRGITGSGKSTFVAKNFPGATVVSADHFFEQAGGYAFDGTRLEDAHRACFKAFMDAIMRGDETIVVDNTNVESWEIAPYVAVAHAFSYQPEVITLLCEPGVAAARGTHGVDAKKVAIRAGLLAKERLPRSWKQRVVQTG
ncbi:MAG: hypothetical protein UY72_C0029G0002 [Candidatus Uhrbacteria bacterium GW2011_GWD2_52_7]|uniref:Uncharacterized protein n=1 Tax=Candidatus Uhrbacteria bacterium GW2011_GWD2_52_7 TaxID=1618989 RepID=A0A0G2ABX9_9BACT|nr:MAG: hypothetical protein UY72_C0029G0002 [Candidatus Uhrbacteria bacterium GW2011_GWD2_52_7]